MQKPLNHNELWKILKEMGIPDHHTCLLRKLYAGQEATLGTGYGTMDWYQIHGLQHARLPCPSPTPRASLNSCPSSQWCHSTISSSVIPFSSCLQLFPEPGSFLMSQLFASGGQEYWSFNFSLSPSNEYSGLISIRIDWSDLLAIRGLSRLFSNTPLQRHHFFGTQLSLWCNSHMYTWPLENHSFD